MFIREVPYKYFEIQRKNTRYRAVITKKTAVDRFNQDESGLLLRDKARIAAQGGYECDNGDIIFASNHD